MMQGDERKDWEPIFRLDLVPEYFQAEVDKQLKSFTDLLADLESRTPTKDDLREAFRDSLGAIRWLSGIMGELTVLAVMSAAELQLRTLSQGAIDQCLLSPHVNPAARLQGVADILVSENEALQSVHAARGAVSAKKPRGPMNDFVSLVPVFQAHAAKCFEILKKHGVI